MEKINWQFNVRRRFCWFVEYFQIMGTNEDLFQKVLGLKMSFSNMKKDADFNEYTSPEEDAGSFKTIKEKADKNLAFLEELSEKIYKKSRTLVLTAENISKKSFEEFSLPEIKILFDKIAIELMEYQPVIFVVFPVEKYLEERLEKEIKKIALKKGLERKSGEYLANFSRPITELALIKEEKSLLGLAARKKAGKDISRGLKEHIMDFEWIPADGPTEQPWTEKDFLERINEFARFNPEERLKNVLVAERNGEKDFRSFVAELELGKETLALIRQVRSFVYLRNYRAECWAKATFQIRPFMEFIAKKAGLSLEEFIALGSNEISDFLATGKVPKKNEIKQRMDAYDYVKVNGKVECFFGKEAKKRLCEEKRREIIVSTSEITGNTANRGKVTGIARIVNSVNALWKVKEGDILVASMTVPQYIPAMEKAAGFITDEGGITCHAAIISRELNVPCIVGTKIATKVFKDGEMLELDATNGIARKK